MNKKMNIAQKNLFVSSRVIVSRTGIHINGRNYFDPSLEKYALKSVTVKIDRRESSKAQIFTDRGKFICTAELTIVKAPSLHHLEFNNGSSITLSEKQSNGFKSIESKDSKFRITLDTSADQPVGHVERSRDTVTPQKGKHYLIKIISEKLDNGKPDKLFGGGNFLAKYNGKFFFIGSLKRRRAIHQVKVTTEAAVNRGKL